ncbi:hypothetical protein D3C71_1500010 [compost metagenome]
MLPSGPGYLKVSAFDQGDLERITDTVQSELSGDTLSFRIPPSRGDLSSLLYRVGDVLDQTFEGDDVIYTVRVNKDDYEKWGYMLSDFKDQTNSQEAAGNVQE